MIERPELTYVRDPLPSDWNPDPQRYPYGAIAWGTFRGHRLRLRWGSSGLGTGWKPVEGDLFGHLPADQVVDVVVEAG